MKMIIFSAVILALTLDLALVQALTVQTRQTCAPIGTPCIPGNGLCCVALGHTCQRNPLVPNSYTCQGGTTPGNCLSLNSPCLPNSQLPGQQCCINMGHMCRVNPYNPTSFTCQSNTGTQCLPLNTPCTPNSNIPGQSCCVMQGHMCSASPFNPTVFTCQGQTGQCLTEKMPCSPDAVMNSQKCCLSSGLVCSASRYAPNTHTCKFAANSCIDQNKTCKKNEGQACCTGVCERNIMGELRCPLRLGGQSVAGTEIKADE